MHDNFKRNISLANCLYLSAFVDTLADVTIIIYDL